MHRRVIRRRNNPAARFRPNSDFFSPDVSSAAAAEPRDRHHSSRRPCCDLARTIAAEAFPELVPAGSAPATPSSTSDATETAAASVSGEGGSTVAGSIKAVVEKANDGEDDGENGSNDEEREPPPLLARMIRREVLALQEEVRRCSGGGDAGEASGTGTGTGGGGGGGKKKKRKKKKKKSTAAAAASEAGVVTAVGASEGGSGGDAEKKQEEAAAAPLPPAPAPARPVSNLQALSEAAAALTSDPSTDSNIAPTSSSTDAAGAGGTAATEDCVDPLIALLAGIPSVDRREDNKRFDVPEGRTLDALLEHIANSNASSSSAAAQRQQRVGSAIGSTVARRGKKSRGGKFGAGGKNALAREGDTSMEADRNNNTPTVDLSDLRRRVALVACPGCRMSSFGYLTELSRRHSGDPLGHGGTGVSWGDAESSGEVWRPSPYPSIGPSTPGSSDGEGDGGCRGSTEREGRVYLRVDADAVQCPGPQHQSSSTSSREIPGGHSHPPDLLDDGDDDVEGAFGYRALEEGTLVSSTSSRAKQPRTSSTGFQILFDLVDETGSPFPSSPDADSTGEERLRPRRPLTSADVLSLLRHVLLPCGVPCAPTPLEEEHDLVDLLTYHPDEFGSCRRRWAGRRRVSALAAGLMYRWLDERCREWHAELIRGELLEGLLGCSLEEGADEGSTTEAAAATAAGGGESSKTSGGGKKSKKKKKKKGKKGPAAAAAVAEAAAPAEASQAAKDVEEDKLSSVSDGKNKEAKPMAVTGESVGEGAVKGDLADHAAPPRTDDKGEGWRRGQEEAPPRSIESSEDNRGREKVGDENAAAEGEVGKSAAEASSVARAAKAESEVDAEEAGGGKARAEAERTAMAQVEVEAVAAKEDGRSERRGGAAPPPSSPPSSRPADDRVDAIAKGGGGPEPGAIPLAADLETEAEGGAKGATRVDVPKDDGVGAGGDTEGEQSAGTIELLASVDARVGVVDYQQKSSSSGGGFRFVSAEDYLVRRLKRTVAAMSKEARAAMSEKVEAEAEAER